MKYRGFDYDSQGNVSKMTVQSQKFGLQVWTRGQDGQYRDQFNRTATGPMKLDQERGDFTAADQRGQPHTYTTEGQWRPGTSRPNAPQPGPDGGQQPPSDGSKGAGGTRGGGDRQPPPRTDDRQPQPPDGADRQPRPQDPVVAEAYDKFYGTKKIIEKEGYKTNLFDAAGQKKPVVMTFYRSGDPGSGEHLNAIALAKHQSNGAAEFMCVDLDKVDPNSAIGKYAHEKIAGKYKTPLTMVFTQGKGDEKTPVVPNKPGYYKQGNIDESSFAQLMNGIGKAVDEQNKIGEFKLPGAGRANGPKPDQLIQELGRDTQFDPSKIACMKDMSPKDRISLIRDANRVIDKAYIEEAARVQQLQKESKPIDQATEQRLLVAQEMSRRSHQMMGRELLPQVLENQWSMPQLKQTMEGMSVAERFTAMNDAVAFSDQLVEQKHPNGPRVAGKARGMMGLMCADLGKQYTAQLQTEQNPQRQQELNQLAGLAQWRGIEWNMSAGYFDKELYTHPGHEPYRQAVLNSGLPGRSAEFILMKGRENNTWFLPKAGDEAKPNAYQDSYDAARALIGEQIKQPAVERPVAPQPAPVGPKAPAEAARPNDGPKPPAEAARPPVAPQPLQGRGWYDNWGDPGVAKPNPPVAPPARPVRK